MFTVSVILSVMGLDAEGNVMAKCPICGVSIEEPS